MTDRFRVYSTGQQKNSGDTITTTLTKSITELASIKAGSFAPLQDDPFPKEEESCPKDAFDQEADTWGGCAPP
jgi:hypothetical protein